MPPQTGKSGLIAKYGAKLRQAHQAHKLDETEYDKFGDLPPGISNGVARLVLCEFKQYKEGDYAGEWFFQAAGVVLHPEEQDGTPIAGLRTRILPEPLCDTPGRKGRKTTEEHLAWIYNELRKLGVDTASLEVEDLEDTASALVEAEPTFRFRTWKGKATPEYPDPRVNHTWNGTVDWQGDDPADAQAGGTVDEGGEEPEPEAPPPPKPPAKAKPAQAIPPAPNGPSAKAPGKPQAAPPATAKPQAQPPASKPAKSAQQPPKAPAAAPAKAKAKAPPPPPEPEEEADAGNLEFGDLASLAALADNGDEDAAEKIREAADQAGVDPVVSDAATSWAQVVEMISGNEAAGGEAEEDEQSDWEPQPSEVYLYAPTVKGKKAAPTECEVMAVDKAKQTCTLRSVRNQKTLYKAVPWGDLEAGAAE